MTIFVPGMASGVWLNSTFPNRHVHADRFCWILDEWR